MGFSSLGCKAYFGLGFRLKAPRGLTITIRQNEALGQLAQGPEYSEYDSGVYG